MKKNVKSASPSFYPPSSSFLLLANYLVYSHIGSQTWEHIRMHYKPEELGRADSGQAGSGHAHTYIHAHTYTHLAAIRRSSTKLHFLTLIILDVWETLQSTRCFQVPLRFVACPECPKESWAFPASPQETHPCIFTLLNDSSPTFMFCL